MWSFQRKKVHAQKFSYRTSWVFCALIAITNTFAVVSSWCYALGRQSISAIFSSNVVFRYFLQWKWWCQDERWVNEKDERSNRGWGCEDKRDSYFHILSFSTFVSSLFAKFLVFDIWIGVDFDKLRVELSDIRMQ